MVLALALLVWLTQEVEEQPGKVCASCSKTQPEYAGCYDNHLLFSLGRMEGLWTHTSQERQH